jgi:hypothetical protein
VIYTIRIAGTTFRPKVFEAGAAYTLVVSDPDSRQMQRLTGLTILTAAGARDSLQVVF